MADEDGSLGALQLLTAGAIAGKHIWKAQSLWTSEINSEMCHIFCSEKCILDFLPSVYPHNAPAAYTQCLYMLSSYHTTQYPFQAPHDAAVGMSGCVTHLCIKSKCFIMSVVKHLPRCAGGFAGDPCRCHQDQAPGGGPRRPDVIQRSHRLLQEDRQGGRFQGIVEGRRR